MENQETQEEVTGLNRRSFLGKAGVGVAGFAASAAVLAACGSDGEPSDNADGGDAGTDSSDGGSSEENDIIEASQDAPEIEWEMATSWPTALVTIFGGATFFADQVSRLTGGRFKINDDKKMEFFGTLSLENNSVRYRVDCLS